MCIRDRYEAVYNVSMLGLSCAINCADRIEVYKGVVPVGFGTDAIWGVVNIVINKQPGKWFMDAS